MECYLIKLGRILENGKETREREKENNIGKQVYYVWDFGMKISCMVIIYVIVKMVKYTNKVFGIMENTSAVRKSLTRIGKNIFDFMTHILLLILFD